MEALQARYRRAEYSHRTSGQESYQRLCDTGEVDFKARRGKRDRFHNLAKPHGGFKKAPDDTFRERL